jgi:hypothetical protein
MSACLYALVSMPSTLASSSLKVQVLFNGHGPVLEMILNRPEALNALTTPMLYQIVVKLTAFQATFPDRMKLVVLSGAADKVSTAFLKVNTVQFGGLPGFVISSHCDAEDRDNVVILVSCHALREDSGFASQPSICLPQFSCEGV